MHSDGARPIRSSPHRACDGLRRRSNDAAAKRILRLRAARDRVAWIVQTPTPQSAGNTAPRFAHTHGRTDMHRRFALKRLAALTALAASTTFASFAPGAHAQAKTIKVGVLHSLSGTMAISETVL